MKNVQQLLLQANAMLNPSEKKVAEYILNHQEEILNLTISELAKKSDTSEATIIRMCRTLQFKGFKDFKLHFAATLSTKKEQAYKYQSVSAATSVDKTINLVASNNIHSIQQTLLVLKEEDLQRAIHAIDKARKVIVIGVGASSIVALDLEQKMRRINRWCEVAIDFHTQLTSISNVSEKDVVIAISYSGETIEVKRAFQVAVEQQATTISITQFKTNSIQKLAHIPLFVSSTEENVRIAATSSTIAVLTVIDMIFMGLVALNFDQYVTHLDRTRETIRLNVK